MTLSSQTSTSGRILKVRVTTIHPLVTTLKTQLKHLNELVRTVFVRTPKRYFKEMLNTLHQTFINGKFLGYESLALLRYMMVLSSVGPQLGVACDYFFQNPVILANDIKETIIFFAPKDRDVRVLVNNVGQRDRSYSDGCRA